MSHWSKLNLKLENKKTLLDSLKSLGYTIHESRTVGNSYVKKQVDIAIEKNGKVMPFGFVKTDGGYELQGDFWGSGVTPKDFELDVKKTYSEAQVKEIVRKNRLRIESRKVVNGNIVIRANALE